MKPRPAPRPSPALIGLLFLVGVLAVLGGFGLVVSNGRWLGLEPSLLDPSPFASYLIPGLTLALVVGGTQLAAGWAVLTRRPRHLRLATVAAIVLGGWIAIQALMIGVFWLQIVMFFLAIVELGLISSALPRESPDLAGGRRRRRRKRRPA